MAKKLKQLICLMRQNRHCLQVFGVQTGVGV